MPEARVIQLHSAESIAQTAAENARDSATSSGPTARVDPIDRKTRAASASDATTEPADSTDNSAQPVNGKAKGTVTATQKRSTDETSSAGEANGVGATPKPDAAKARATRAEELAQATQKRARQPRTTQQQATEQAVAESASHHPSAQGEPVDAASSEFDLGPAEILERYDEAVARWAHALGTDQVDALLADAEPDLTAVDAASAVAEAGPRSTSAAGPGDTAPALSPLERKIAGGLAFLRRRVTGDYEVDEFGFDRDLVEHVVAPGFTPIYKKWFRTEVLGAENIPTDGGALLVANHAGGIWALDGAITTLAIYRNTPNRRVLRMLGADLVFTTPGLAPFARKSGATLACNADAERLLDRGELVGVWPEGFKGIGKPFSERYKLQRFGRGGFVTAALRAGVPIIPISIVGSEEIHPVLGNAKTLARLLNVPYFPITPTFPWLGPLGLVPFPSKWYIEFGEPIPTAHYGPEGADDPMLVFELTDRVRETIQSTLYRLLVKRRSVWR